MLALGAQFEAPGETALRAHRESLGLRGGPFFLAAQTYERTMSFLAGSEGALSNNPVSDNAR